MSSRNIIYNVFVFLFYLLLQIFLFQNMVLFGTAFCFIYVGFILLLPIEISSILLLTFAFVSGLIVDLFYNSAGVNAAAAVLVAFIRPVWLSMITPRGGYEDVDIPALKTLGFSWFTTYMLPLIFIHHLSLFLIEAGEMINFWFVLNKAIFSTLYTFVILVIGQYLFYSRVRYV